MALGPSPCAARNASTCATFESVRNAPGVIPGASERRSDTKLNVCPRAHPAIPTTQATAIFQDFITPPLPSANNSELSEPALADRRLTLSSIRRRPPFTRQKEKVRPPQPTHRRSSARLPQVCCGPELWHGARNRPPIWPISFCPGRPSLRLGNRRGSRPFPPTPLPSRTRPPRPPPSSTSPTIAPASVERSPALASHTCCQAANRYETSKLPGASRHSPSP